MPASPLRIGFIDYQLENFHANVFLKSYRESLLDDAGQPLAEVAGCWAMDDAAGKAWAQKHDVRWFARPMSLAKSVDALMILSPSNPEHHLPLLRKVVKAGLPVYVDKPSAPDMRTLTKLFELADKHGAAVQTTSALRYTAVQQRVAEMAQGELQHIITWGPGRSFDEYAIHPVELAVSCMGSDAQSLMVRQHENFHQLLVNFSGGRTATMHVCVGSQTPYAATLVSAAKTEHITPDLSRLFIDTAAGVLDFLQSGKPNIPREESMMVRRILDAAVKPAALKRFVKI